MRTQKRRSWGRISETDGPWFWFYQEQFNLYICFLLELSSIKLSEIKKKKLRHNRSHLRIATGLWEMSFCQFQVHWSAVITASAKHILQRVRSFVKGVRPISHKSKSDVRQTIVQTQPKWETWCPELHSWEAFPLAFCLLFRH